MTNVVRRSGGIAGTTTRVRVRAWFVPALAATVLGALLARAPGAAIALALLPALAIAAAHPRELVIVLAALAPFEDWLLKFLPVSDTVYSGLRFLTEIAIYVVLALVVSERILSGKRLRRTAIDGPVLALLAVIGLSFILNRPPVVGSIVNIRAFLRYVALFYLAANLTWRREDWSFISRMLVAIGVIQLIVSAAQGLGGDAVRAFFLPRTMNLEVGDYSNQFTILAQGREAGSVFGTVSDTITFGALMVVVYIITLARARRFDALRLVLLALIATAVAFSYSRACAYAVGLATAAWFRYRFGLMRALTFFALGAMALVVAIALALPAGGHYREAARVKQGVLTNIVGIFSKDYVGIAKKQRLAAILGTVPAVLATRPLLGYGPDEQTTIDRVNSTKTNFLLKVWDKSGYKDVYWVAFLSFFGVLGVCALMWLLLRVLNVCRRIYVGTNDAVIREAALASMLLVIVTIPLLFLNNFLEFKPYGLYLWLFPAVTIRLHEATPALASMTAAQSGTAP